MTITQNIDEKLIGEEMSFITFDELLKQLTGSIYQEICENLKVKGENNE